MEISGLMGQMPSRLGYQPTMGTELSRLEERIANTDAGAITSISSGVCAGGRFDRPGGGAHLFPSLGVHRSFAQAGE